MIHLTNQNFTSRDIVQNVFSPLVGALCSPLADEMCQKNNLSFVEMLQPFTRLSTDAYFHDPTGATNTVKGIRINVCDVAWRPPQTMLARKMLTDSVATALCDKTRPIPLDDEVCLDIPTQHQWFEQWRETFLTVQFPSDHEFTRHLLSCLIVLSSSDPTPLDTAQQLTRQVQSMQTMVPAPKLPKWFMANDILNCYVMLHDASQGADISRAQQSYESLKLTFGEHRCFLLQINSNTAVNIDNANPWAKFLRRHPRAESYQSSGEISAPRTPQDVSVTMLPLQHVQSGSPLETPPTSIINGEVVDHPLSPVQEHATEAIHSNLSTSCESLSSNLLNPNVWAGTADHAAAADPDQGPHGMLLTAADLDNLKHFVQDFSIRSLIPYVEKQVVTLNEAVTNKKGRSLLSVTKRWFVTNKPGVASAQNAVVYTPDSIELQTRKLGDLYFMFGNYNMAFQHYHQAKRDFSADSAWQFYAGALEMAALAAFMNGTSSRKTYDYMEEAIVTYLNNCKLAQFATRATLLSVECLRTARMYSEAAKQLIRMTSEDSDLRSALLLEQAAQCFLLVQPQPLHRKYAFHIVLAGHRFSKSGQRRHAFRCYKQAYQVFENRGWSLAEDHIQYTIGKQAVTLKKMDEASAALAHLLRPSSLQSSVQQAAFLREYIVTQKAYLHMSGAAAMGSQLPELSLPKIVHQHTRVLVAPHPPVAVPGLVVATNIAIDTNQADEWKWHKLEEIVVQVASKKPTMIFKPTRAIFSSDMPSLESPLCVHGEPIEIRFALENTIKPSINFEDIHLLWTFQPDDQHSYSNDALFTNSTTPEQRDAINSLVTASHIVSLALNECDRKAVSIRLIPLQTGRLRIDGVVGRISATNEPNSLWGKLCFPSLPVHESLAQQSMQFDRKLELEVLPPAPSLHVQFSSVPHEVIAGEVIPVTVTLTNSGNAPLGDIYAASETPRWVLGEDTELPLSVLKDFKDLTNEALIRDKEARRQHSFCLLRSHSNGITLQPNETRTTTIYIQAHLRKGPSDIKLLIHYAMPDAYPKIRYRLVRHIWHLNVNESLSVSVNCSVSNMCSGTLGVNVTVNNLNQVHHPLMTEIYPRQVCLYCPRYELDHTSGAPIVLHSPDKQSSLVESSTGLRTTESLAIYMPLAEKAALPQSTTTTAFVQNRLSSIVIKKDIAVDALVLPPLSQLNSFLMKNETKFIGVLGQTGNNEEFNQIVTDSDPHMTFAITWRAVVNDNSSQQRQAFGQHFVQLRNLYETVSCPPKDKVMQPNGFPSPEELIGIYDSRAAIDSSDWQDEQDDWEDNDVSVASRCFLEVNDSLDDRAFQQQHPTISVE